MDGVPGGLKIGYEVRQPRVARPGILRAPQGVRDVTEIPDTEPADRATSGVRSVRTGAAFLIGFGGFGAAVITGGDLLVLVVMLFISGVAGALVASGSARIWAPVLRCWTGLAGTWPSSSCQGKRTEPGPLLFQRSSWFSRPWSLRAPSPFVLIRNIGQR